MKKITILMASLATIFSLDAFAQRENNQSKFDLINDFRATPMRSALGVPGEQYWQNRADYNIVAELDDAKHTITATSKLTYTNNSPDALDYVWLQLEQNKFKEDSRGTLVQNVKGSRNTGSSTEGNVLKSVRMKGAGKDAKFVDVKYIVTDTRIQVILDAPLKAKGGKVEIEIAYSFFTPEKGSDRMGRIKGEKGWVYSYAQWYPRACVYDDIKGWNTEPYLGSGEFYLEYGDLEYKIITSNKQVVIGSGDLLNPADCYTPTQVAAWKQAETSDKAVVIIDEKDANTAASRPAGKDGKITWHFKILNARDAAFGCSSAFAVDAARINLPSKKKCLAISGYTKEGIGTGTGEKSGWERSTEYSKASIEHYSKMWYEFPYPVAVNLASICGGMEYPGVNFCDWKDTGAGLWGVTDHEFGHNWFPMIVGTNERLYPWMDEGFNTFINYYSTMDFNNGEYAKTQPFKNMRNLTGFLVSGNREGINTYPDIVQDNNLGITAYYKPAIGMIMLREYILGKERFDYAFRNYIKRWAFKHPQPTDFFNAMENAAGDELDWFWKGWFYGTGNIEQGIGKVEANEKDGSYTVSLENNGTVLMPTIIEGTDVDGKKTRMKLPVEIWQKGNKKDILFKSAKKIVSFELDPDKQMPDIDSKNDVYKVL